MNKNLIKIVKRNKEYNSGESQISLKAEKTEKGTKHSITHTINDWIDERRENRRKEKVFSNDKIAAWHLLPKTP